MLKLLRNLILVNLFIFTVCAEAAKTVCTVDTKGLLTPEFIGWDDVIGTAMYGDKGRMHEGQLKNIRQHDSGVKINLFFRDIGQVKDGYQYQYEFILFGNGANKSIIGVTYKLIKNEWLFDSLTLTSTPVTCRNI